MLNWDEKATHLTKLNHHEQVYFALFCAKQVLHLTDLKEAHECVRLTELWLEGKATSEQCRVASDAAYAAAYAADHAAAGDVEALKEAQMTCLEELINMDQIVENTLLG